MAKKKTLKVRKKAVPVGESEFDRIMDEILGDVSEGDDLGELFDSKNRSYVLRKILESADRMIDSLENAWEIRPVSLSPEDESRILEAIERARQLRNKIANDLLPKGGIFAKDIMGEA